MNPFTRFLRQWLPDDPLHNFVERWDELEALILKIYRGGQAVPEDQARYQELRPWLRENYVKLEGRLRPYWQASLVAGTREHDDPFLFLIAPDSAEAFVENWAALQHLPAAREALNQLIVEKGD